MKCFGMYRRLKYNKVFLVIQLLFDKGCIRYKKYNYGCSYYDYADDYNKRDAWIFINKYLFNVSF